MPQSESKEPNNKPFDASMLNEFWNRYVSNLIGYTIKDAESLPDTGEHSIADTLLAQAKEERLEQVDCDEVTQFLESIDDDATRKNLTRSTRALMKHTRWNIQFGWQMRRMNRKPKEERYEKAIELLNAGKKVWAYPSARTAETVISYASTVEQAMELVDAFYKRGVNANARMLTAVLNITKTEEEAFPIIDKFAIDGVAVDTYHLNRLVTISKDLDTATKIVSYYARNGVEVNTGTISSLVKKAPSGENADKLIKASVSNKICDPDIYVLNSRLSICETLEEMNKVIADMEKDYGVKADAVSSSIKIKKALELGDYDYAEVELEKAKKFPNSSAKTNSILARYETTLEKKRREQEQELKQRPDEYTGDIFVENTAGTPKKQASWSIQDDLDNGDDVFA